jgi:ATP-dependent RNA helicase DDX5/DBP2
MLSVRHRIRAILGAHSGHRFIAASARDRHTNEFRGSRYDSDKRTSGQNQRDNHTNQPKRDIRDVQLKKREFGDLAPFKKDLLVEHPEVKGMTAEFCRKFLADASISIKGMAPIPKPMTKFEHAQLPDYIMNLFASSGFSNPTSIQALGWPIALSGRDGVFIANTGSGKSLGFIVPMLLHIAAQPPLQVGDGPIALVLAPTRELVMQISKEASTFGRPGGVLNAAIYGGVSRNGQAHTLKQGVEICVATPGRLIDFLESGVINLDRVTYLVLDEADRMLDMGFEPQIRKILSQIRPDKQTTMYSATWNSQVSSIAKDYCTGDPVLVTVGKSTLQANPDIHQTVAVVESESDKRDAFKKWLADNFESSKKMIVFTDTKRGADNLCRELTYNQHRALSIHGDKDQRQRDQILRDFKNGEVDILVATDVAARGLDIKGIDFVVNFDCPKNPADYLHRIGRCGRAGAKGVSMTLIATESDSAMMSEIAKIIADVGQVVPSSLKQTQRGGNGELRKFMNRR